VCVWCLRNECNARSEWEPVPLDRLKTEFSRVYHLHTASADGRDPAIRAEPHLADANAAAVCRTTVRAPPAHGIRSLTRSATVVREAARVLTPRARLHYTTSAPFSTRSCLRIERWQRLSSSQ